MNEPCLDSAEPDATGVVERGGSTEPSTARHLFAPIVSAPASVPALLPCPVLFAGRVLGAVGHIPIDPEGVGAVTMIRCETGDDVEVPGSSLVGANLRGLSLHRALLESADLRAADLSESDLRSAWLDDANLEGAILVRTHMPACSARRARFTAADLSGAFMRSGGFEDADFSYASLSGANVGRARFVRATLIGADLRAMDLGTADLTGAIADQFTRWPDNFDPARHGVNVRARE